MAACKGCGVALEWEQEGGKYIAYETTGQRHRCPNYGRLKEQQAKPSVGEAEPERVRVAPTVPPSDPYAYEAVRVLNRIEALLKRLVELAEAKDPAPF